MIASSMFFLCLVLIWFTFLWGKKIEISEIFLNILIIIQGRITENLSLIQNAICALRIVNCHMTGPVIKEIMLSFRGFVFFETTDSVHCLSCLPIHFLSCYLLKLTLELYFSSGYRKELLASKQLEKRNIHFLIKDFPPEYDKYSDLYNVIKKTIISTVADRFSKVSIKSLINISQVLPKRKV